MDYSKVTLDELKKGYRCNKDNNAYICNYCEQHFEVGQIFSIGNNLYTAEHAISKHIQMLHGGNLSQLISSDTKYNTLTQNQKDLITLFASGMSDKKKTKGDQTAQCPGREHRIPNPGQIPGSACHKQS